MQAVGKYIVIEKPEKLNDYPFIIEPEMVMKAKVVNVSADISTPKMSQIIFQNGAQIAIKEEYFVPVENVLMYD